MGTSMKPHIYTKCSSSCKMIIYNSLMCNFILIWNGWLTRLFYIKYHYTQYKMILFDVKVNILVITLLLLNTTCFVHGKWLFNFASAIWREFLTKH